eukprot:CAMPEP_0168414598 /NCGR_PEP_ID=MMETSP0228-20121227/29804_1 /TAXON_ID=133427 /ORGANISM="Protoceratium reticulatum, Strain CCCM 535 (=CCMP 1889)" /LENGTH=152 /DNA_ID=CAMNT_0008428391 /DNA_START=67 /DNA_END=525 /DNA_ORIENTATION=-
MPAPCVRVLLSLLASPNAFHTEDYSAQLQKPSTSGASGGMLHLGNASPSPFHPEDYSSLLPRPTRTGASGGMLHLASARANVLGDSHTGCDDDNLCTQCVDHSQQPLGKCMCTCRRFEDIKVLYYTCIAGDEPVKFFVQCMSKKTNNKVTTD